MVLWFIKIDIFDECYYNKKIFIYNVLSLDMLFLVIVLNLLFFFYIKGKEMELLSIYIMYVYKNGLINWI